MHGICPALFGKRVRNRCACRPRLQPDSVEFDEEMRRPERIGGFAGRGRGGASSPGKSVRRAYPASPVRSRISWQAPVEIVREVRTVRTGHPLRRMLRTAARSAGVSSASAASPLVPTGCVVAERQAHPAVGSGVQGGERFGEIPLQPCDGFLRRKGESAEEFGPGHA